MIDRDSENWARDLFEWRVEDSKIRFRYLSILADAIDKVNSLDKSQWAVTATGDYPRLVVGHYYTYSTNGISMGVWLALDTESLENMLQQGGHDAILRAWKLDPQIKYRHAKDRNRVPFSTNGYYDLSIADPSLWTTVEKLSFRFIAKALDIGQRMPSSSREAHASGILKYMRSELGRKIPDPKL
jgi:hypothetical protein